MKMKKRLTAWLTCVAMVLSLFAAMPMTVLADGPTVLNISEGAINITEPGTYIITGTSTTNTITVAADVYANITLDNVNIDVSDTVNACAFLIGAGSTGDVTITLEGKNILKSGFDRAGIEKGGSGDDIGTLTIEGEGSLEANGGSNGAGIGGGGSDRNSSNITINSGTITAIGGSQISGSGGAGTGIGGGNLGSGSNITINGGTVTANAGTANNVFQAAGIGGGGAHGGS